MTWSEKIFRSDEREMKLNQEELKKRLIKKSSDINSLTRKVSSKKKGSFVLKFERESLSRWIFLCWMFLGSMSMSFFPNIVNSGNTWSILLLLFTLNTLWISLFVFLFFPYDIIFSWEWFFSYHYWPFWLLKKTIIFSDITDISIYTRERLIDFSRSVNYYDVQYTLNDWTEHYLFSNSKREYVDEFIKEFVKYHKVTINDYSSVVIYSYRELSAKQILLYTYLSVFWLIAFIFLVIIIWNYYF